MCKFKANIYDAENNLLQQTTNTVVGGYVWVGVKSGVEFIDGSYITTIRLVNSSNPAIAYTLNLWDQGTETFQFLSGPGGTVNPTLLLYNIANNSF